MTPEEKAEGHIAKAVEEIVKGNNSADGEYVIVISPSCANGSVIYTWQWFWSPKAPVNFGRTKSG